MIIELNKNWTIAGEPLRQNLKFPPLPEIHSDLPGDVILALMNCHVVPDPYFRDNFRKCSWIGEMKWHWRNSFSLPAKKGARYFLNLDGLAYPAKIFLNGKFLGEHKNMHRLFRVEITDSVQENNDIEVTLQAFDPEIEKTPILNWFSQWADGVYSPELCRKRGAGRKADYTYGWDWAQGLPVCGIEGGAFIECYEDALIRNTVLHTENTGKVSCNFDIESAFREVVCCQCTLSVIDRSTGKTIGNSVQQIAIGPGVMEYQFALQTEKPKLWYPAGYGQQPMYDFVIQISFEQTTVVRKISFAFREISIQDRAFSEKQGEYRIVVNGKPVYAQGCNWIPPEQIPARADNCRYEKLIQFAKNAGINYFRFWGGGIYERELFYDLCDEAGIMLWHDFMLSGTEVPEFDPVFRHEIHEEVRYQIQRLAHHPSIVVWCGGNELDSFHAPLGDLRRNRPRPMGLYYGARLIYKDIPHILQEVIPEAVYVPTCPTEGKAAPAGTLVNAPGFGSTHRNILHQFAEDSDFDQSVVPPFWNEFYGFSPACDSSLKKFLSDKDLESYNTPVMEDHSVLETQRNDEWTRFFNTLSFHHPSFGKNLAVPEIFDYFHEAHCELLKRYIEFLRRNLQYSGGYGYWMYNSAFPMFDLSIVDYYLAPKPEFYAFKRASRPILPIAAVYPDRVDCILSVIGSDLPVSLKMTCSIMTFSGEGLYEKTEEVHPESETSHVIFSVDLTKLKSLIPEKSFISLTAELPDGTKTRNHRFFVHKRNRCIPNAQIFSKLLPDHRSIILKTDSFASDVEITPCDQDNYPDDFRFDMLPGEEKKITFAKPVEKYQIAWRNHDREPYPVDFDPDGYAGAKMTIYNPSSEAKQIEIFLEGKSEILVFPPPRNILLQPYELAECCMTASLSANAAVMENPVHVIYHIGKESVKGIISQENFPFLKDGKIALINQNSVPFHLLPASFSGIGKNGTMVHREIPSVNLLPGEKYVYDFGNPAELRPYGGSLNMNNRHYPLFLYGNRNFSPEDFDAIPTSVFDRKQIIIQRNASFLSGKNTIRFEYGKQQEAKIYLAVDQYCLITEIYLKNVPWIQRNLGEKVWVESCVELAVADSSGVVYRDYSMAKTENGPELFLRRGSQGFVHGFVPKNQALFQVRYFRDSRILAYRMMLDCKQSGIDKILKDNIFHLSLIIREPGIGVPLFESDEHVYGNLLGGTVLIN